MSKEIRNSIFNLSEGSSSGSSSWPPLYKMDLRLSGIDSDGLSLAGDIGSGAALKQMPALSVATNALVVGTDSSFLMLDGTATYEYLVETVIDSFENNAELVFMGSKTLNNIRGWQLNMKGSMGVKLVIKDILGQSEYSKWAVDNVTYWRLGFNTVSIKFNLPTKGILITINGVSINYTHDRAVVFDTTYSTCSFSFGHGGAAKIQAVTNFRILKNDVIIKEFLGGEYQKDDGSWRDLISSSVLTNIYGGVRSLQDYGNPYKSGYDLYWLEDTLKYQNVNPVSGLGISINPKTTQEYSLVLNDYPLFKRILPTELGYHILNYIELPDLPIFNTTDRTYWKASITSDPYYVGGTAGRERWFHKTWLDFDWIDTHIETAYRYLFFVKCHWVKAKGQTYIKTKIDDIVLFNEVSGGFDHRRDTYETIDLGNFYQSTPMTDDADKIRDIWSNGLKNVCRDGNYLRYSSDGGHTYSVSFDFSAIYPVVNISYIKITNAGNILIFSDNKLVHYSDDNLVTITAASVKNMNGTDYVFHNPVNGAYPGSYFKLLNSCVETDDCIVIGNYANSGSGASPINLYYSIDDGAAWKVFYTYGQNPKYTDDGSVLGGIGGNLVGDAGNSIITTRIEGINVGYDGNIYVSSEGDTIGALSSTMMKCVYNSGLNIWSVTSLTNETSRSKVRMRCNGLYEKDGFIYWVSAGNAVDIIDGVTYSSLGIFKCAVTDIDDFTKHIIVSVANPALTHGCGSFKNNPTNGKVLANFYTEIHLSSDYGETWEIFTNKFNSNLLPVYNDIANDCWIGGSISKIQYLK